MEVLANAPITSIAALSAAAAYLNAKFSVSTDLQKIFSDRNFSQRLEKRIGELGDTCSLYGIFDKYRPHDEHDAIWFEGKTMSYGELRKYVDQFAGLLRSRGVTNENYVGVFMVNSPEMVVTVLALSKLGAIPGLINTNLRSDTLTYSLEISTASLVVTTPDLSQFVDANIPHLSLNLSSFGHPQSLTGGIESISSNELRSFGSVDVQPAKRQLSDNALLIYTSGTTGKPKACAVKNMQIVIVSLSTTPDFKKPSKYYPLRTYSPLPLFHGTAFFGGLTYTFGTAGTICLGRKFSASNFWKQATESRANRILYVGELCRYLLASPPSPYDQAHSVNYAYGNGLRVEIWDKFKQRFNIPEIREFYRSTEGLAKFDNWGVGAWGAGRIGFAGPVGRLVEDTTFIVRYDPETQEPYRDPKSGFCVKANLGEEGEIIGRINNLGFMANYLNNDEATEKKILRDVFKKGDMFQRMGDLAVHETDGWVRFQDRVGDTFRWKGENVSAGEVRDHISALDEVTDAIVFGVKLSSYDGQAGAACISLKDRNPAAEANFMATLQRKLQTKGVPSYAMPRLVRVMDAIATSATFKQAKTDLAKLSWDPRENAASGKNDRLYWLDSRNYRNLDGKAWDAIEGGSARL